MSLIADVERLKQAPMPEVRETIAEKVAFYFNSGIFDSSEKQLAAEILRLLAKDVESRVRKVLAENLKHNTFLPHDIALNLAKDITEVSLPILEYSEVLTDRDLIEIIKSTKELARLNAISRRRSVSPTVSKELIATKEAAVVESLVANKGARISEDDLLFLADEFHRNGNVVSSMISRGNLPVSVVERMITMVSAQFRDKIARDYNITPETVRELITHTRETTTLQVAAEAQQKVSADAHKQQPQKAAAAASSDAPAGQQRVVELIEHLYREGRLSHSIVLRALCEGNLPFFEIGIAKLASIPYANAHTLVHAENSEAFRSLYSKAHMPASTYEAVALILKMARQQLINGKMDALTFRKKLVEHIVTNGYDKTIPLMPYMLAIVSSDLSTSDILQ